MIILSTSDKGGTGRSVTSCNLAYRRALQGSDVAYLDFDFGSPTAGAILSVSGAERGTTSGAGLHHYLQDRVAEPEQIDVWSASEREGLRGRPMGAGRLVLVPGDQGGGEFPVGTEMVDRCIQLFLSMEAEFELVLVDLSAGRSQAADLILSATAARQLQAITVRWLVFHRWTRQHIIAASGLVFGERGLIEAGTERGHDRADLENSIRFVRTAVLDLSSPEMAGLRPPQAAWLQSCNRELQELATKTKLGRTTMLGSIPLDPVLQWREQLISDNDVVFSQIANPQTSQAYEDLAKRLVHDEAWMSL
ncbi:MAG: DNA-binding protein [Pseudonocardiales bacterium]|nr:MAG: DNA-binding protein [Pseudonocardiales bacterium]